MFNQRPWGPLHRGFPTTFGLYCLEFDWQLHRGFPRSPSVGCGLPYHISSLTLWESAGNCSGVSWVPPRSGVAFPTTSGLYCLEVCWQLHRGFPRTPSVGCGLRYHIWSLLSGILLTTALGPELNWVKKITQLPHDRLLDLWNRMFNRHQAEITVMQFRGYSLPVHDCNGRMGPSPFPIS